MGLVIPRAVAARGLLLAAAVAALVTTVLLTAFVQYAYWLPEAGVRQAVADAPALQRALLLSSGAGRSGQEVADRDAASRELFADGLGGVPLRVEAGGYAISQRLPDDLPGVDPGAHGAYAVVGFLSGLDEHVDLVAGDWPGPAGSDEAAEVVVPADLAEELELSVGDRIDVLDEVVQEERPLLVVGLWHPRDTSDGFWQLAAAPLERGGVGPFVVHEDVFVDRYQRLSTLEWVAVAEPAALAAAGMGEVARHARGLEQRLMALRDDDRSPLDSTARLHLQLDQLADQLASATVVNRSGLVLPAALLVVIAGYGLMLVARLLSAHRRGENALLRARGASRRKLVGVTAAEALLVVSPAALVAPPVGTWLVGTADRLAGDRSLGLTSDLAAYGWSGPAMAWVIAGVAAAGCAVALAVPAAGRGRTWIAEQQERSRPGKAQMVQRAGVDVALVAVAVLAWLQLRQYGQAVSPRDVGGLGIDPLLVAAPVVAVLAATAVALRVLPLATKLGVRLASRRDAFPGLLGMWQADRRPHAGPVLLLVLAVATAVLAPTMASTWQQSQRDQAGQAVGADLRLSGSGAQLDPQVRQVQELSQVDGLMSAYRSIVRLPEGDRVPLLAVDSAQASQVALVRSDLAPAGVSELFDQLHRERPQPRGVPLPEGAQRLTGTVRFEAPEPPEETIEAPVPFIGLVEQPLWIPPNSQRPSVHVTDRYGMVSSLQLTHLGREAPVEFDVELPVGVTELTGLSAGLELPLQPFGVETEVDPFEVSWHWEDLAVVDGGGETVPVELPDFWELVHHPTQPQGSTVPEISLAGAAESVVAAVNEDHLPQTVPFLLTDPVEVPGAPAWFTPQTLAAAGAEVGQAGEIVLGDVTVRVAGVAPALPGVADGEGIAVDLPWMSLQLFREMRVPPAPNEWWVATADPQPVVSEVALLPVAVHDRQAETDRLLGDPLGAGVLLTLWAAAVAAALLAAFGLAVDSRASAVRRQRELAVLHTLGVSPAGLARALVVEQAMLAGLGVLAGMAVGVAVAATMGPSLVLTPAGAVPVPEPLLTLSPLQFAVPTVGLFVVSVVLGALVARRARRDVVAGALRIGED